MNTLKTSLLSIALCAALAAAGCGGGGGGSSPAAMPAPTPTPAPTPPPTSKGESFTAWSKTGVFALPEAGAPVIMDGLDFNFDGDDNANAYIELLPAG